MEPHPVLAVKDPTVCGTSRGAYLCGGRWQHFLEVLLKGAKLVTSLAQHILHQLPEGWLREMAVRQLRGADTVIRACSAAYTQAPMC